LPSLMSEKGYTVEAITFRP